MKGKLIVFEGPEGCGKTTKAKMVYNFFKKKNKKVVLLREPGGIKISEQIRKIILNPKNKNMCALTELLLYEAARAQLVCEKIKPLLKKGYIVLMDRFYLATTVYQGYGRGISKKIIDYLNNLVTQNIKPDLTIIYDVSRKEALKRLSEREKKDRIEQESSSFHNKIRRGYLKEGKLINAVIIKTDGKSASEVFDITKKVLFRVIKWQ
ncbi:MAG: dTMP kinase [Candidatus Goldbacteria bacterium]|nr:dTMP kinase [Candidatus Goldiibacteriota bacterium]